MKNRLPEDSLQFLGIGLQLSGTALAGIFLGYFADKKLGTLPWCTLAGSALGLFLGFYNLLRQLNKNENR